MTPKNYFDIVFKDKNFMTPKVITHWKNKNFIAELSCGNDFNNNLIYGLTILEIISANEVIHRIDLGDLFTNKENAKIYFKSLSESHYAKEKEFIEERDGIKIYNTK